MKDLLSQIKKALDEDLYLLSLFVALTIPDICGAISSEDGEAKPKKYMMWFDKYIADKYYGFLTGEDCYYFRCSLLHQGTSQHNKSNYKRVLFVEPSKNVHILHNNIMNGAFNIDVRIFCEDFIEATEKWLKENENTNLYKKNYSRFMRRYPNGLPPYIVGIPVIS